MNHTKRAGALLLALLMALTLLSGCGAKKTELQVSVAMTGVPATMDPAMVSSAAEKTVVTHLYENLLRLRTNTDGGLTEGGAIAKSWKEATNENGSVTYTFTLRTDAVWSDGRPVTAADFVYAWQRLVNPDTKSPNAALLDMVAGYAAARKGSVEKLAVSAPDDFTLQVTLTHPCPYFLSAICTASATMPLREDDLSLTNGAYTMGERSNNAMQLQAAENFYDSDRIGPTTLTFAFCAAAEDTALCWEAGTCDAALGLPATYNTVGVAQSQQQVAVVVINQMAKKMASDALCAAMSQVIDRNAIAQKLQVLPAAGLIPTGIPNTQGEDFRTASGDILDNEVGDYAKLCQTAWESVTAAEVDPAALGSINFFYEQSQEALATLLQEVWQNKLNLTVKPVAMSAEDLQTALSKGEFTLALTSTACDRRDATGYLNAWRSGNYANFHSSAFDMLLRAADNSQSTEARDAYLEDAERLLLDKGRVIPLYYTLSARMMRSDLTGLAYDGLGTYDLRGVHKGA